MTSTVGDWDLTKTLIFLRARKILKMRLFQIVKPLFVQANAQNVRTDFGSSAPKSYTKGSRLVKVAI